MAENIVKFKYESDGPCFGLKRIQYGKACDVMDVPSMKCGTYCCPFYKPTGCSDWIRRDGSVSVELIPPEKYEKERKKHG